ncbi:MAG TPA: hypothetical protein VIX37_06040, partial [Candidatus Sulfotelmatobacter sp.]
RNGLLHQGQTKDGWRIRTGGPLWDIDKRTVNRDKFSAQLDCAFEAYIQELNGKSWSDAIWVRAARRVWWLIEVSRAHP